MGLGRQLVKSKNIVYLVGRLYVAEMRVMTSDSEMQVLALNLVLNNTNKIVRDMKQTSNNVRYLGT